MFPPSKKTGYQGNRPKSEAFNHEGHEAREVIVKGFRKPEQIPCGFVGREPAIALNRPEQRQAMEAAGAMKWSHALL